MKRAFVVLLLSAAALAAPQLSDVPPDHWARQAVYDLAEAGIIEGFPDGTFRGDEFVTRYQLAMLVWRLIKEGGLQGADPKALAELAAEISHLRDEVTALKRALEELRGQEGKKRDLIKQVAQRLGLLIEALDKEHQALIALRDKSDDLEVRLGALEARFFEDHRQLEALADLLSLINDDVINAQQRVDALAADLKRYATKDEVKEALERYAKALEAQVQQRLELLAADVGSLRKDLKAKTTLLEEAKPVLEEAKGRGGLKDVSVEGRYTVYRGTGIDFGKGDLFGTSSVGTASGGSLEAAATYTNWGRTFRAGARIGLSGAGLTPEKVWGEDSSTHLEAGAVRPDFDAYLLHRKDDYPTPGVLVTHSGTFAFGLFGASDGALGARFGLEAAPDLGLSAAYAGTTTEGMAMLGLDATPGVFDVRARGYYHPSDGGLGGYVLARMGQALEGNFRIFPAWTTSTFVSDDLAGPYLLDQEGWSIRGQGALGGLFARARLDQFRLQGSDYRFLGAEAGWRFGHLALSGVWREATAGNLSQDAIPDGEGGELVGGYGVRVALEDLPGLTAWGEYLNLPSGWNGNVLVRYEGEVGPFEALGVLRYRGFADALKVGGRLKSRPFPIVLKPSVGGGWIYARTASGEEVAWQAGLEVRPAPQLTLSGDVRGYKGIGVGDLASGFDHDPFDPEVPLVYGGGSANVELRGFGLRATYRDLAVEALLLKDVAANVPYQRFSVGYAAQF